MERHHKILHRRPAGPAEDLFARALRRWPWSQFSPTAEPPRSALTLRLVLATFGMAVCGVFAGVAVIIGRPFLAIAMAVLTAVATFDIAVILRHRAARGPGGRADTP
ncbi:hypothetical protein GCM10010156_73710 [Planobispora rosea]|uniref:Uncharacterized protein n=1 Tax=Planobispora rosea TaxID=35762 RepID=A0A8J3SFB9_PLARO|nr:DUF6343 family protein [Planobispora rosea]GGT05245.1 hypothetical protein GCM10010156_73710 [Planobispora rosea]GIH88678.1 hypothetical protein Pro02_70860 [Planobispora rosea]